MLLRLSRYRQEMQVLVHTEIEQVGLTVRGEAAVTARKHLMLRIFVQWHMKC